MYENSFSPKELVIDAKQALKLQARLSEDLALGYFNNFSDTLKTIKSALDKLVMISRNVLNKELSYYEVVTLRANGYLKGKVPTWYYPKKTNK